VLSRSGLCSRGQARELLASGLVTVDGRVERDPGRWVDPGRVSIAVAGRPLEDAPRIYLAVHKPKGYVTTRRDPEGRRTVYDLLGELGAWVGPVGRLDRDTSGLLLFTNDTALAEAITNPATGLVKRYRARVAPPLAPQAQAALAAGVELDDGPTRPAEITPLADYGGYGLVEIAITEGRNRQVRRMVRAVGSKVQELRRLSIGPVELGELPSGGQRPLTVAELTALRAAVAG
jgi:23S rRNA pseudouridine2605 synthase